MRTTRVLPVQSPSLSAWITLPRASSLASGATESSRSMNTSSAGRAGAFCSILGEDPGTDRHERRGLVTRSGMVVLLEYRKAFQAMVAAVVRTRQSALVRGGLVALRGLLHGRALPPGDERRLREDVQRLAQLGVGDHERHEVPQDVVERAAGDRDHSSAHGLAHERRQILAVRL